MIRPKKSPITPVHVTIYDGDIPIGGWVGMAFDPKNVRVVIGSANTVSTNAAVIEDDASDDRINDIARRSKVYTKPRAHMKRAWQILERHGALQAWLAARRHSDLVQVYIDSIHTLWWEWFDEKLNAASMKVHLDRIEPAARMAYAQWLLDRFTALGKRGADARYTLRTALAAFKRGDLKLETFDTKLVTAEERLRLLRGNTRR
jgi:hypothetical protein